jgi:hypothetical protein
MMTIWILFIAAAAAAAVPMRAGDFPQPQMDLDAPPPVESFKTDSHPEQADLTPAGTDQDDTATNQLRNLSLSSDQDDDVGPLYMPDEARKPDNPVLQGPDYGCYYLLGHDIEQELCDHGETTPGPTKATEDTNDMVLDSGYDRDDDYYVEDQESTNDSDND